MSREKIDDNDNGLWAVGFVEEGVSTIVESVGESIRFSKCFIASVSTEQATGMNYLRILYVAFESP